MFGFIFTDKMNHLENIGLNYLNQYLDESDFIYGDNSFSHISFEFNNDKGIATMSIVRNYDNCIRIIVSEYFLYSDEDEFLAALSHELGHCVYDHINRTNMIKANYDYETYCKVHRAREIQADLFACKLLMRAGLSTALIKHFSNLVDGEFCNADIISDMYPSINNRIAIMKRYLARVQ